ncbi:MAG: Smr/MutS family protein [Proteobacteria bacterium]|nr:Smr/MutS family protein [Pseudomonadota bacterium]
MQQSDKPFRLPVDGVLDLHTFQPADCRDLVPDYLEACRGKGILQVRIIHGKGRGVLRQTVHRILERLPCALDFYQASEDAGGWGATIVILNPADPAE